MDSSVGCRTPYVIGASSVVKNQQTSTNLPVVADGASDPEGLKS